MLVCKETLHACAHSHLSMAKALTLNFVEMHNEIRLLLQVTLDNKVAVVVQTNSQTEFQ